MAAAPVTGTISSDLMYLFDGDGVPKEIGEKLGKFGINTVAKFAALVKDQDDLRVMLKKEFGLDAGNPEQLRKRVNVMGAAWVFVASQHTTRSYLQNAGMRIWTEYCDFLLGSYVLGLMTNDDGGSVSGQDWAIILEYEQEIRREMVRKMQDGKEIAVALRESWNDPLVKDRHLITALQKRSLKSKQQQQHWNDWDGEKPLTKRQRREKGKGKGKDAKKGKNERVTSFKELSGCADTTPDGKKVCYPFNKRGPGCNRKGCPFAHVCGICFKAGVPMYKCRHGAAEATSS